jgi:hypothetical protein
VPAPPLLALDVEAVLPPAPPMPAPVLVASPPAPLAVVPDESGASEQPDGPAIAEMKSVAAARRSRCFEVLIQPASVAENRARRGILHA